MLLTPVTQADSEFECLLAKSPDGALHPFGNSSHRRLRLGVRPQLALIFLGPGPPFHLAPGSFYSLFLPFGQLGISTVGLESVSLWHYRSHFVHCLSSSHLLFRYDLSHDWLSTPRRSFAARRVNGGCSHSARNRVYRTRGICRQSSAGRSSAGVILTRAVARLFL